MRYCTTIEIILFLFSIVFSSVHINSDSLSISYLGNGASDSLHWKIPYEKGEVFDLSTQGVYRISSCIENDGWNKRIEPTFFIGPSPFPVIIRINGEELYRWGDLGNTSMMANFSPEVFLLHDLHEGKNKLDIDFYSDGQSITFPDFYIGEYNQVVKAATNQKIFNLWLIQAIAVMALFAFLLFLGYSASSGFKDRDILYFSFFALTIFLSYSPFIVNAPTSNDLIWFKVSRIGLTLLIYFIHLFCSEFTNKMQSKVWRIILTVITLVSSLFLLEVNTKSGINKIFSIMSIFYYYPMLFLNLALLIRGYISDKKNVVLIIILGYSALVITGVYDLSLVLLHREPYFWTAPYGYFIQIIAIVAAVALRHSFIYQDLVRYKAELVYTNQSLIEAHSHVVQESQAKEQFIKAIAHEFRTPLNGMSGSVQSLLVDSELPESVLNKAIMLSTSFYRFELIVQNLLDYQTLKSGTFDLQNACFKPVEVINGVVDLCRDNAKSKNLSLISLVRSDFLPEFLIGDSYRIGLIINNLISNSIKFTSDGGISVKSDYVDGRLMIEVADTGCGIEVGLQDEIFNAFERVEELTFTQRYEGIGLGLAIVDAIVKKMNGTIVLKSQVGRGTTFTVLIPLPVENITNVKHNELHILVADDNMVNRKVAVLQLEKSNIRTAVANNGKEALALVKSEAFDLILMDVQMPIMDGLEATRHIKKLFPNLPVIGMTANASRQECLLAGMDDVVFKPTSSQVLNNTIAKFV